MLIGLLLGLVLAGTASTARGQTIKPYVLVIVDTSGSMSSPAGGGGGASRMQEAVAALADVFAGVGEVTFALQGFVDQSTCTGACSCTNAVCTGGDMLVPFYEGNQAELYSWVDGTCNFAGGNPELGAFSGGGTPLAANLTAARSTFEATVIPADPARLCRPYVVVLVTDGEESCSTCPAAVTAVSGLCDVSVPGRAEAACDVVKTYVIGFDVGASACLDAMATAGGTGRTAATSASDDASLALAFQEIVASAVLVERCDGADNDCDGLADEDYPGLGTSCTNGLLGACARTGTVVCRPDGTGTLCDAPTVMPGAELCDNGVDDDCDGLVDEGCPAPCTPTTEVFNCRDDDCDGFVDEGTTPGACGIAIGECLPGTYACVTGILICQGGTGPTPEICDGLDNDCDTVVDGIIAPCYGFASGCTGDPVAGFTCAGICQPGSALCTAGAFGLCLGHVGPLVEALCNGLDDDCDGLVDEDPAAVLGSVCAPGVGACGPGLWACVAGALTCVTTGMGGAEVCNFADDDCDGAVDEPPLPGAGEACTDPGFELVGDTGECAFGATACVLGAISCVGYVGPQPEVCNARDDDCDGVADDMAPCPLPEQVCVAGECAGPCVPGEFPCADGFSCVDVPGSPAGQYCVKTLCFGVICAPNEACNEATGACVDLCEGITCDATRGLVCVFGFCVDCADPRVGCAAGSHCLACGDTTLCRDDPCAPNPCPAAEICSAAFDDACQFQAVCVADCATLSCDAGERCVDGRCEPDRCAGVTCAGSQICDPATGGCVNACGCAAIACGAAEICSELSCECVLDPCATATCPAGTACAVTVDGLFQCRAPDTELVWAAGSGCACRTARGRGGAAPVVFLVLAGVALLLVRRRGGGPLLGLLLLAALLGGVGCDIDPYPLGMRSPDGAVTPPDARVLDDGAIVPPTDGAVTPPDACFPAPEVCDGLDNDCDGTVDEGFDLATDPSNCGACGTRCELPQAAALCAAGSCVLGPCQPGFHDVNGVPGDGCEYACLPGGAEVCDTIDNDCDGVIDEGVLGVGDPCGDGTGECVAGVVTCGGGVLACTGAIGPTVEVCDGLDNDCDSVPDNGYDVATNPYHCGACNAACVVANAIAGCAAGACVVAACVAGFFDADGLPANGCEVGCTFSAEICNGVDDDCDGLVDAADPDLAVPAMGFCTQVGACAGATPACTGAPGWICVYPAAAEVGAGGALLLEETRCDGLDGDCDGAVDETFPLEGTPCDDGAIGACRGVGTLACNAVGDALACAIATPGALPSPEVCNGVDDDCNGVADDGVADDMVHVVSGGLDFFIYRHEASRPDATSSSQGALAARSCSVAGVLPWTNVSHTEATAACAASGKRLCSEQEWQLTCAGPGGNAYPYGNAFDADACNGEEYDPDCALPDDDLTLPTGAPHGCPTPPAASLCVSAFAVYDLSGNVKEWTGTQVSPMPPSYRIRGGAHDNIAPGLTCGFDFVAASPDFYFSNLGFRCCVGAAPTTCATPADCDNGLYCDGTEGCTGGFCTTGAPPPGLDDGVACTADGCDEATDTITHTASAALCDDGNACTSESCDPATGCLVSLVPAGLSCTDGLYCNGVETCNGAGACGAGAAPCVDADPCTTDTCAEATDTCSFPPKDADGDGFVDVTCGGTDCNDASPAVNPAAPELCDGADNNCNGVVDEGYSTYDALCATDAACCSGNCGADGRCDYGPPLCEFPGATCASPADCCDLSCNAATLMCEVAPPCAILGSACTADEQCCSDECVGGVCATGGTGCRAAGVACEANYNCCSGTCTGAAPGGSCLGNGPACRAMGDACTSDGQCCGESCDSLTGRCDRIGFCRPAGEACADNVDCCTNLCTGGYCQPPNWCQATFETCDTAVDCCSFRCFNDPDGFKRCLPIGGCRTSGPTLTPRGAVNNFGELCTAGFQCCSGICSLDAEGVSRCTKAGSPTCGSPTYVCQADGELCETDCQCCSATCVEPRPPDAQGPFPKRCLNSGFGVTCIPAGGICADSGECCAGLPCTPWSDMTFRCGFEAPTGCVGLGDSCSTFADCCGGLTCVPVGTELRCLD